MTNKTERLVVKTEDVKTPAGWEKIASMGMPAGEIYAAEEYLYVGTKDGVYRQRIYEKR